MNNSTDFECEPFREEDYIINSSSKFVANTDSMIDFMKLKPMEG